MIAYSDLKNILSRSRLVVSGDRITLWNQGSIEILITSLSEVAQKLPPEAVAGPREEVLKLIDELVNRTADSIGQSSGKLHKSLHKSLHRSLHKSLHKALHKSGFGVAGDRTNYSGDGMSWPSIEVPWREFKRLYDRRAEWDKLPLDRPPGADKTANELRYLHDMQRELREPKNSYRRARIRIEASNDLTAYMLPLGADVASSASRTAVMFQIILWLGSSIGQLYKARYEVPRPHQVDPTLEPFIPVPIYSSYPSNHAFQSFLIAEVFSRMVPEHPGAAALYLAAWEVAINREYAGLHYRSDTLAGKELATLCAPVIHEVLEDHVRGVRAEWLGEGDEQ